MTEDIERFLAGVEFGRTAAEIFDGQPPWAELALANVCAEIIDLASDGHFTTEVEAITNAMNQARQKWEADRNGA